MKPMTMTHPTTPLSPAPDTLQVHEGLGWGRRLMLGVALLRAGPTGGGSALRGDVVAVGARGFHGNRGAESRGGPGRPRGGRLRAGLPRPLLGPGRLPVAARGVPPPGCVLAPTRIRLSTSSLLLCGRKNADWVNTGSGPKAFPR